MTDIKNITEDNNKTAIDFVEGVIKYAQDPTNIIKDGKAYRLRNAVLKDNTGEIAVVAWNSDVDKFDVGNKIRLENCYCSVYKGKLQLTPGKFGKIICK